MPGKGKGANQTPPGWRKGKKTGWQGAGIPPGLARKADKRQPEEEAQPPDSPLDQRPEQAPPTMESYS